MANRLNTPIDALAAPSDDGGVLVWPGGASLAALAESNRRALGASDALVLDRPLREWRSEALGDAAVIMTGHQAAFFHAGVWIKNAVTADLAQRVGGRARFLVVDSDQSRGVELAWPVARDSTVQMEQRTAFPSLRQACFEQLPAQTDAFWRSFWAEPLTEFARSSELAAFSEAFCAGGGPVDYTQRWIGAMSVFDRRRQVAGLEYFRISEDFENDARASALTAHLILQAESFAAHYNAALDDYRSRRGVRGREHPIPDLAVSDGHIELPFWLIDEKLSRRRAFAAGRGDAIELYADQAPIGRVGRAGLAKDPRRALHEAAGRWRIRPRALTLMIYARLLVCDLFVHGVGGAKYDQITDRIIGRFFGIHPPGYGCATATLRLPLQRFDAGPADIAAAIRRLRDLRHNPQRVAPSPPAGAMLERAAAIEEGLRLRETDRDNRPARRANYERIRRANAAFGLDVDALQRDLRSRVARLSVELGANRVAESREWFAGLHTGDRLAGLRARAAELCR